MTKVRHARPAPSDPSALASRSLQVLFLFSVLFLSLVFFQSFADLISPKLYYHIVVLKIIDGVLPSQSTLVSLSLETSSEWPLQKCFTIAGSHCKAPHIGCKRQIRKCI